MKRGTSKISHVRLADLHQKFSCFLSFLIRSASLIL